MEAEKVKEAGIILHQFWADLPSCKYHFKNGTTANFAQHLYRTSNPTEIKELNDEIAAGIGAIRIPDSGATINSLDLDPVKVLKDKIIAEYLAEQKRANNNGESFSDVGDRKPTPANTTTLAAISAESLAGAQHSGAAAKIDLSHLKK
jgi:hypothetical protein